MQDTARITRYIILYLVILTLSVNATAVISMEKSEKNNLQGVWQIGERKLPAPAAASQELQQKINAVDAPNIKQALLYTPNSIAGWKQWRDQVDQESTAQTLALAKKLNVSIRQEQIADVRVFHVLPEAIAKKHRAHMFFYLHGGAYILGAGKAGLLEAVLIASRIGIPVLSVDYRMAPDHPAPASIDDVVAVWQHVIKNKKPRSVVMGGNSAGAGLALGAAHRFAELNLPMPAALYLASPLVDLTKTGDSRFINEGIDRLVVTWDGISAGSIPLYAGELDLKHPYISPIYRSFDNFPPAFLASGTRDMLLSDTVRAHRQFRAANIAADLHVYEGQSHVDFLIDYEIPESCEHYQELNLFLLKYLKR